MLAYLLDRFRTDADTLRARAATLRNGPAQPGPDANMSTAMANACDTVTAMLQAVPATADAPDILASLQALIPLLEKHAHAEAAPPVRAVYAGAATRVREVTDAEAQHLGTTRVSDIAEDVDEDVGEDVGEDVDEDVDEDVGEDVDEDVGEDVDEDVDDDDLRDNDGDVPAAPHGGQRS